MLKLLFLAACKKDIKKKKMMKNPDVDTSFLPDREREVGVYYLA